MAINLRRILARIDEMGVEAAVTKLNSYDVSGPSSEEFFGASCVQTLDAAIQADEAEEKSDSRCTYEQVSYSHRVHIAGSPFENMDHAFTILNNSFDTGVNKPVSILTMSEFCNDNLDCFDPEYYSKAA
ncbi:hypothetical protein GLUCOINTEAF2_0203848 [Komagataeibacter intermedius AF2]|uniref:Uncharacterized protein n=1 Tax=Komagataeibacter intermedius AF2 TaxID=1458464 RepID=A0A0N1FAY7_9PROT|nr:MULTISPECIES: hypothetical protein [Komagataeibacter]KPH88359.1 hypothetical protein GLUCOINTEAF2_0203848 [Komagataeibacter intermedius AF2]